MREPSPRTSRFAIAGGLVALIVVGGGGFLLGRATTPTAQPIVKPLPVPTPSRQVETVPEQILRRADLIDLGAAGADALASGTDLPKKIAALAGKRFELNLPFGCDGPAAEGSSAPMRWRYDEESRALRVHAAPMAWQITDWWRNPPRPVETMEGFWIERPWSLAESCPRSPPIAAAPSAEPVTLPGQTLGLVQLTTAATPRQMRRDGKPYQAVVKLAADEIPSDGLALRLTGRLDRFPDGLPVRCRQAGGREQRPICLIAVSLDEVAIRNPDDGETLAAWQPTADAPRGEPARE